jgi:hypothetical protein
MSSTNNNNNNNNSSTPTIVELNVSGELLTTTLDTLRQFPIYQSFDPTRNNNNTSTNSLQSSTSHAPPTNSSGIFHENSFRNNSLMSMAKTPSFDDIFALRNSNFMQQQQIQQQYQNMNYQHNMNTNNRKIVIDKKGRLFIDRDATLFRVILNFVRSNGDDSFLPIDKKLIRQLLCESEYFGWNGNGYLSNNLYKACISLLSEDHNSFNQHHHQQQQSRKPDSSISLLKMNVYNTNHPILNSTICNGVMKYHPLPFTTIDFEVHEDSAVLFQWYFGDCAGEFSVQIDSKVLEVQPAVCGVLLENLSPDCKFDFASNAFIKSVAYVKKGKHSVTLLWRTYKTSAYQIQGPVISEVYKMDSSVCHFINPSFKQEY